MPHLPAAIVTGSSAVSAAPLPWCWATPALPSSSMRTQHAERPSRSNNRFATPAVKRLPCGLGRDRRSDRHCWNRPKRPSAMCRYW